MTFKMKYEIKQDLLPLVKKGRRQGSKIGQVKFLVAHDVGNDGLDKKKGRKNGTTARSNINYYRNTPTELASAQTFIDWQEILECIPASKNPEKAWHVLYNVTTDNKLFGADANDSSIGIELCYYPEDKNKTLLAYQKYIWYLAYLCDLYSLNPLKHITGHHILDPGRKTDPLNALKYLNKTFSDLLNDVQREYIECTQQIKGVEIVVSEQTLNAAQEAVRQKAIGLGITDGKNAFREANQYYIWSALIPAYERITKLEEEIKNLKALIK